MMISFGGGQVVYGREWGTLLMGALTGAVLPLFTTTEPTTAFKQLHVSTFSKETKSSLGQSNLLPADRHRDFDTFPPAKKNSDQARVRIPATTASNSNALDAVSVLNFRREAFAALNANAMEQRYLVVDSLRYSELPGGERLEKAYSSHFQASKSLSAQAWIHKGSSYTVEIGSSPTVTVYLDQPTDRETRSLSFWLAVTSTADGRSVRLWPERHYYDPDRGKFMAYFSAYVCPPIISAFFTAFLFELPTAEGESLTMWAQNTESQKWVSLPQLRPWVSRSTPYGDRNSRECRL